MSENDRLDESLVRDIKEKTIKCWNCNFCYSKCPLYKSMRGFMINGPSGLIQSIYYALKWDLFDKEYRKDIVNILYSCTTCNSCVQACSDFSAGIPILEIIESGRRLLLERMIGPAQGQKEILESLNKYGNPYGKPASKRLDWYKELRKDKKITCRTIPDDGQVEILLFVGCTASFDENIQNVAKSIVLLLEKLKVNYGVLKEEKCCGSPARQIGEEGLFIDLSGATCNSILESGAKQIITISPHCYNSFKNEYPDSFKKVKIQHYTEFFDDMIQRGKLSPKKNLKKTVTFHDPCYLGKRNEVYNSPRAILSQIPGINLVEMKSNKRDSLCCGGGEAGCG